MSTDNTSTSASAAQTFRTVAYDLANPSRIVELTSYYRDDPASGQRLYREFPSANAKGERYDTFQEDEYDGTSTDWKRVKPDPDQKTGTSVSMQRTKSHAGGLSRLG